MAWDNAVVTDAGVALLRQVLAGETLALDGAGGGAGTVDPSALMAQTALADQRQNFPVTGAVDAGNGKKITIQITNQGLAGGYALQQVGIWAHAGAGESVLFAVLQDGGGVPIPAEAELQDFALSFYAVVDFSNEAEFSVTVNASALVSAGELAAAMGAVRAELAETQDGLLAAQAALANVIAKLSAIAQFDLSGAEDTFAELPDPTTLAVGTLYLVRADETQAGKMTVYEVMDSTANYWKYIADWGVDLSDYVELADLLAMLGAASGIATLGADGKLAAGQVPDLPALGIGYGTCPSSASASAKVATRPEFVRKTGSVVGIKFSYANTSGSLLTLNVNNTGAGTIYDYRTNTYPVVGSMGACTHFFQFNGTQWILLNPITRVSGTATISVGDWAYSTAKARYAYSLFCAGLAANQTPHVDRVTGTDEAAAELINEAWRLIVDYPVKPQSTVNTITFYAAEKPEVNLPIMWEAN